MNKRLTPFLLTICLVTFTFIHLFSGEIVSFFDVFSSSTLDENELLLIKEIRLPRTIICIIAGAGLSISGLLMQTYFSNPLAGPSILGISSGASLLVALTTMTGISFFTNGIGVVTIAILGALAFCLLILFLSSFIKSTTSLLILGIMLSSLTSSFIQIIQNFSDPIALKAFTLWGFGSVQHVYLDDLPILIVIFCITLLITTLTIKPLNAFVIGEEQASYLGVKVKNLRYLLISITAILTGLITAYCGPISFIGIAIPNLTKMIFKTTNHSKLIIGTLFFGACSLLLCDILLIQMEDYFQLPINSITALFGAPIIISIILKRKMR